MILQATLLFSAVLVAAVVMPRAAAATRHALLAAAQAGALLLPLLPLALPAVSVPASGDFLAVEHVASRPLIPMQQQESEGALSLRHVWLAGFLVVASQRLTALVRAISVVRRARGGFSSEIDQPMAFGRSVLLPESARTWSGQRVRAVTLHELAHVRRRDTLVAMLGDLACAVYWFHPLAWLVARRAQLERERACDDAVLAAGIAAEDYALAIVDVARGAHRTAMALPMASPSQLETRIAGILDPAVPRRAARPWLAVMLVLLVTPALAALEPDIARPQSEEPDLRRDSPPESELLPSVRSADVDANGPDAAFIAFLTAAAKRQPRSGIDYVPERARWALSRIRDGELVPSLLASLHSNDWRVQAYAAWALGYSADARATAPVIELLSAPRWRVRSMAAHALANLGDPAAEAAMLRRVDDPAWQVRTGVARYLAVTRTHREVLVALRTDRHMAVREIAEEALR